MVQRYAGTLGPYELSSGGGTPRIRGNWQNALESRNLSITVTTYHVARIRQVAADRSVFLSNVRHGATTADIRLVALESDPFRILSLERDDVILNRWGFSLRR